MVSWNDEGCILIKGCGTFQLIGGPPLSLKGNQSKTIWMIWFRVGFDAFLWFPNFPSIIKGLKQFRGSVLTMALGTQSMSPSFLIWTQLVAKSLCLSRGLPKRWGVHPHQRLWHLPVNRGSPPFPKRKSVKNNMKDLFSGPLWCLSLISSFSKYHKRF